MTIVYQQMQFISKKRLILRESQLFHSSPKLRTHNNVNVTEISSPFMCHMLKLEN